MVLKEKVEQVLHNSEYEFDITDLISIPCKRAYISLGNYKDENNIRIYSNTCISKGEFEKYLYNKTPQIENMLKNNDLTLNTESIVIEFDNCTYMVFSSSEWLYVGFEKD